MRLKLLGGSPPTLLWPKLFAGYVAFPYSEKRGGDGILGEADGDGSVCIGWEGDQHLVDLDWYYEMQAGVGEAGELDGDSTNYAYE